MRWVTEWSGRFRVWRDLKTTGIDGGSGTIERQFHHGQFARKAFLPEFNLLPGVVLESLPLRNSKFKILRLERRK